MLKTRETEPCTLEHNTTWYSRPTDIVDEIPLTDIRELIQYDTIRVEYVAS